MLRPLEWESYWPYEVYRLENLSYHNAKPVILAETGAVEPKHAGPSQYYPLDTVGIILHDALFAPFFSGAAGAGMIWHWDQYVANNNY